MKLRIMKIDNSERFVSDKVTDITAGKNETERNCTRKILTKDK